MKCTTYVMFPGNRPLLQKSTTLWYFIAEGKRFFKEGNKHRISLDGLHMVAMRSVVHNKVPVSPFVRRIEILPSGYIIHPSIYQTSEC